MSTPAAAPLRTVAFGDLESGVWGASWGDIEPFVTVGMIDAGSACFGASTRIDGSAPDQDWTLSGPGIELTLSPAGEPAGEPGGHDFDQLCRVRGRFVLSGAEQTVDSRGRRGSRAEMDLRELESIRDVSAWFDPDEGLALTALRPRGAGGHDLDQVSAAVFEPARSIVVADPRLSTTYTSDGLPARVSIELWLDQDPEVEQFPRRAAGEALVTRGASAAEPTAASVDGEPEVQAQPLRCHSRGREGAGVYLLVRPR